jgi:hypothetical protein
MQLLMAYIFTFEIQTLRSSYLKFHENCFQGPFYLLYLERNSLDHRITNIMLFHVSGCIIANTNHLCREENVPRILQ